MSLGFHVIFICFILIIFLSNFFIILSEATHACSRSKPGLQGHEVSNPCSYLHPPGPPPPGVPPGPPPMPPAPVYDERVTVVPPLTVHPVMPSPPK